MNARCMNNLASEGFREIDSGRRRSHSASIGPYLNGAFPSSHTFVSIDTIAQWIGLRGRRVHEGGDRDRSRHKPSINNARRDEMRAAFGDPVQRPGPEWGGRPALPLSACLETLGV